MSEEFEGPGDDLLAFYAGERRAPDLSEGKIEALLERVSAQLAGSEVPGEGPHTAGTGTNAAPIAPGSAAASASGVVGTLATLKWVLPALLVGGVLGVLGDRAYLHTSLDALPPALESARAAHAEPAPVSVDAVPQQEVAPSPALAPSPDLVERPPARESAEPRVGPMQEHSEVEGPSRLVSEQRQLEVARAAVARGRYPEAIAVLRRASTRFEAGVLTEERDALLIEALVRQGEAEEAQSRAVSFARAYPGSLYRGRVERLVREAGRAP